MIIMIVYLETDSLLSHAYLKVPLSAEAAESQTLSDSDSHMHM